MGHVVSPHRPYHLLQQKLDRAPTGAPDAPEFIAILRLLFTPEEAEFVRHVPSKPTSLDALSRKLDMPPEALDEKLTGLAERGLMLDFEIKGNRFFMLPPLVVGLFEFVFMRARDGLPMAELSKLFDQYMFDGPLGRALFQKETQIGRTLVHEEALPKDDHTEILDWERASHVVKNARAVGVSLCACRHKAGHLGKPCRHPMENCMTLNEPAVTMARNKMSRLISNAEGMRLLEQCREAGLAQTGDNVQRNLSYICNCCGCCCGMMKAIWHLQVPHAIVTSNWIMNVDTERCKGCGLCAKACPIRAIDLKQNEGVEEGSKPRKHAVCNTQLCLGCGACYPSCKQGAIRMKSRDRRVFTPETAIERVIMMALERGKLADLLFEDPEQLSHRALQSIIRVLEKTPPVRAIMAVQPLRSKFLNVLVKNMKTA